MFPQIQLPSGESELQESNLRLLFVRQRPSHWTKPHYFCGVCLSAAPRQTCSKFMTLLTCGIEPLIQCDRLILYH